MSFKPIVLNETVVESNSYLARIANALEQRVVVDDWEKVISIIRAGNAGTQFPVGTQFTTTYDSTWDSSWGGQIIWDVGGTIANPAPGFTYGLYLLSHYVKPMQFDEKEFMYKAESAKLTAGTYCFTLSSATYGWTAGTYNFTLTQDVPVGGGLIVTGYAYQSEGLTNHKIQSFSSNASTTVIEEVAIASGSSGTSLGTWGDTATLNEGYRISYGSNNYEQSAVRQWLNSDGAAGTFWTPQTKFDRPPSWNSSAKGFMGGLPDGFKKVLNRYTVKCSTNNVYESPDSRIAKQTAYTVSDYFAPPTQMEIYGSYDGTADGTSVLTLYDGASQADRIKYLANNHTSATYWWTRSPYPSYSGDVRRFYPDGSLSNIGARGTYGVAPACILM